MVRKRTGSSSKPLRQGEIMSGWTPEEYIGLCDEDNGFQSLGRGTIIGTSTQSVGGMCDNPNCEIDF